MQFLTELFLDSKNWAEGNFWELTPKLKPLHTHEQVQMIQYPISLSKFKNFNGNQKGHTWTD